MTDFMIQKKSPNKLETYKSIISGIEFMEDFMKDPDVLSPKSPRLKNFLIQSFSYLHSDFHYLSFICEEDVDVEIVKAARILQILPVINTNKLFDNMCESDIKKFWDKFFSLFKIKKQSDFKADSIFSLSWENKIDFFKDMKSTFNYISCEFPVVNFKKLSNSDINKEISNWKELTISAEGNKEKPTSFCSEEEQMVDTDAEKLLMDIKKVLSMYMNMKLIAKETEFEHLNFFTDFIPLAKNILKYKKNIEVIKCIDFNDLNCKMLMKNVELQENLYFLRRCNNLINTLKSKYHCALKI